MRRPVALAPGILAAVLILLIAAAPAAAAPPTSGSTELQAPGPIAGETLWVDASIRSVIPVVPYEYAIQNECAFPARSGSSYQRDDIVYWSQGTDGYPHALLPVHLQSVPAGSTCKVFLVHNHTVAKGSTTSYTVG